jgi:hypothetical protein
MLIGGLAITETYSLGGRGNASHPTRTIRRSVRSSAFQAARRC